MDRPARVCFSDQDDQPGISDVRCDSTRKSRRPAASNARPCDRFQAAPFILVFNGPGGRLTLFYGWLLGQRVS